MYNMYYLMSLKHWTPKLTDEVYVSEEDLPIEGVDLSVWDEITITNSRSYKCCDHVGVVKQNKQGKDITDYLINTANGEIDNGNK